MNIHQGYALRSRPEANEWLRRWAALTRTAIFAGIMLTDAIAIVSMSLLTGIVYHLVVHGQAGDIVSYLEVGLLSAVIFVMPNLLRGEYALTIFYPFKPHLRRSIQLWNVTFICLLTAGFLAQISVIFSRGWIVLFYTMTICVVLALRYACVQVILHGPQAGLLSARRIFLVGTGRHIDEFVTRYQPWLLGVNVIGCHFLAPAEPGANEF